MVPVRPPMLWPEIIGALDPESVQKTKHVVGESLDGVGACLGLSESPWPRKSSANTRKRPASRSMMGLKVK